MTERQTNPWLVLLVMCTGFFMILLDTTIVNIAIPSIITGLHASLDQILWVLNAYILTYAVLLITAGRLGDMVGPRILFVAGMAVFTLASALCGLAQDTNQLIAARVVQGVGAAFLTPQTLSILTAIFPPERRGAAFGLWGAVAGVAAIAGPTLGGFIVSTWGWRWIFYVNLPVGILAIVATFLLVPDLRPGRMHRLDYVGVITASLALFAIVFGLVEGQRFDWGTIAGWLTIPEVLAAGVVLLVIFVVWERAQDEPLVPLALFRNRNFSLMNWVSILIAFGMLGLFLPFVIYLQSVLGMSAFQAGLAIAPLTVTSMFVAPIAGRMSDRIGGKYILMSGLLLFGVGMALLDWRAAVDSSWSTFLIPLVISGLGMGCVFAPLATVAMRNIRPQEAGAASGVLNTTRQVGQVLGGAVVGAILQNRLATALHDQAVAAAPQLPPSYRDRFVDTFSQAGRSGLDVGAGQTGGRLPADLPAVAAQQIQQLAHDVFVSGFVAAMRPTLAVPVALLFLGSLSCLAIQRRKKAAEQAQASEDYAVAAGH
jgi:EmrB/QacA subfamily drug resistance transporter